MADALAENIILQLKEELKSKYSDFRGIYFFGSRARGDYHKDSDYDIAVVFDREISMRFEEEIFTLVFYYEVDYEIIIDIHVLNETDLKNTIAPLIKNIRNEGYYYAA